MLKLYSSDILYNALSLLVSSRLFVQERLSYMAISYKKLWKLLIDKNMNKGDLCKQANISSSSVTKLGKDRYVSTEIIDKICLALDCRIEDVMEIAHQ